MSEMLLLPPCRVFFYFLSGCSRIDKNRSQGWLHPVVCVFALTRCRTKAGASPHVEFMLSCLLLTFLTSDLLLFAFTQPRVGGRPIFFNATRGFLKAHCFTASLLRAQGHIPRKEEVVRGQRSKVREETRKKPSPGHYGI